MHEFGCIFVKKAIYLLTVSAICKKMQEHLFLTYYSLELTLISSLKTEGNKKLDCLMANIKRQPTSAAICPVFMALRSALACSTASSTLAWCCAISERLCKNVLLKVRALSVAGLNDIECTVNPLIY